MTETDYRLLYDIASKRIEELEQQIEKMKCCYNCNHFNKEKDIGRE